MLWKRKINRVEMRYNIITEKLENFYFREQRNTVKFFMLCNVRKVNERQHKKICVARDFLVQCDVALFKYPIKFVKLFIVSLKKLNKFSI